MTLAPCPVHGTNYRALHEHNFRGIVTVIEEIILTLSGVGTTSFSYCPVGYPWNFEGVVRALEDLNLTASGIQGGGGGAVVSGVAAGPGISIVASGSTSVISLNSIGEGAVNLSYVGSTAVYSGLTNQVLSGSGISVLPSGTASIVNAGVLAGPNIGITYSGAFVTISGAGGGGGGGGASVTVSGSPAAGYTTGDLWFDTNEGRLFVYASGAGVSSPGWYQTNAEAIALKSDTAPSGTGLNSPPRDGSIWFNTLMGSLFVYDVATSGWYETGPQRSVAYGVAAPAPSVQGAGWYDSGVSQLKVWNGSSWINA